MKQSRDCIAAVTELSSDISADVADVTMPYLARAVITGVGVDAAIATGRPSG